MKLIELNTKYQNILSKVRDEHPIWQNKLLKACENGDLSKSDLQYLFSQYYYYSKNFTKLIAIALLKNDDDYHRAKLSANLWEESGEIEIEKRHAEIFRKFLVDTLCINVNKIEIEPYTELFFNKYLELCLNAKPYECFSMLSFGTEGIISTLYSIFKKGLIKAGYFDEDLLFFNIHIECDDEHALTLEEMALSYSHENHWLERSISAINSVLDLRNDFFNNIYKSIQLKGFNTLIKNITPDKFDKSELLKLSKFQVKSINDIDCKIYMNTDLERNINFTVDRIDFKTEILDPRIVHIPVNSSNELHNHAHETIFLILDGKGTVIIDDIEVTVVPGDLVYVPRWSNHQTRNNGDKELKFFAITDYGFTKTLSINSESVYRERKDFKYPNLL